MDAMTPGARWVRGTGKFHLQVDGSATAVCGRDVPDDPQLAVYNIVGCAVCTRKAPAGVLDAAELDRKKRYAEHVQAPLEDRLAAHRAGRFAVLRCRTCGAQHATSGSRGGVPYCWLGHHAADLEVIEVQGPAWNPEPVEVIAS